MKAPTTALRGPAISSFAAARWASVMSSSEGSGRRSGIVDMGTSLLCQQQGNGTAEQKRYSNCARQRKRVPFGKAQPDDDGPGQLSDGKCRRQRSDELRRLASGDP